MVREGYEGLVRGNVDAVTRNVSSDELTPKPVNPEDDDEDDRLINNLRFGDGGLLKEGEGDAADHPGGRSLKGRYIIRVGWTTFVDGLLRCAPRSCVMQLLKGHGNRVEL